MRMGTCVVQGSTSSSPLAPSLDPQVADQILTKATAGQRSSFARH